MNNSLDYTVLNQTLSYILSQFDLNQKMGGCSITIFHQGKPVTQLAHGIARLDDTGQGVTWTGDTLALNFSTGKGVLVTLIHILVSQGLLQYDTPISDYWADFGQNGKQTITLRHVLSHEANLFDITQITDHAKDMFDWQAMLAKVASMPVSAVVQTQQSEKTVAYSALVSGWVLGGLVEKVTELSLQQTLETYLLQPLNLVGQVYIGVPTDKLSETAQQLREKDSHSKPVLSEDTARTLAFYQALPFYHDWQQRTSNNLTTQTINSLYFSPTQIDINDYKSALVPAGSRQFNYYHPASLQAKIPAANGVASSHALATIYAMLADNGCWQGKTVIDATTFSQLSQIHNQQLDKIMPAVMQWRLGYHRVFSLLHDMPTAFGHMGYNGSMAWCDPSRQLAVAFVHNYDVTMLNDIRQFILNETILNFFEQG